MKDFLFFAAAVATSIVVGCSGQSDNGNPEKEKGKAPRLVFAKKDAPDLKQVLEKARSWAEKIQDSVVLDPRNQALALITAVQSRIASKAGDEASLKEAQKTLALCKEPFHKTNGYSQIALAQVQMGKKADALETFSRMGELAKQGENASIRESRWETIVECQAEAGVKGKAPDLFTRALECVEANTKEYKALSLGKIAVAQAQFAADTGDKAIMNQALETANKIPHEVLGHAEALADIANIQAQLAVRKRDKRFLDDARKTIAKIKLQAVRGSATAQLALAQAKASDLLGAQESFRIALQTVENGEFDSRNVIAIQMARAAAASGDMKFMAQAEGIASQISENLSRAGAYDNISRSYAQLAEKNEDENLFAKAVESAKKSWPTALYPTSIFHVAAVQAETAVRTGNVKYLDQARHTMGIIKNDPELGRTEFLTAFAAAQVRFAFKTGKESYVFDGIQTAQRIGGPGFRAVAAALAENGRFGEPNELSLYDHSPEIQVSIYLGLAEGLMRKKGWWAPIPFDK